MTMESFVAKLSDSLGRIVNQDLVDIRKTERMEEYISDMCKELEKTIGGEFVTYIGYEPVYSRKAMREINSVKGGKKGTGPSISTEETYARTFLYKFKLRFKGEERDYKMPIEIPLITDDGVNYLVNGNKICAPFQIVDAVTYNRQVSKNKYDEVCLKTLLTPIYLQRSRVQIKDVYKNTYTAYRYNIRFNKKVKNIPFMLFHMATFGIVETMKYYDMDNPYVNMKLYPDVPDPDDETYKDDIFFRFGTLCLGLRRSAFLRQQPIRDFVATMLALSRRTINEHTIMNNDSEFWTVYLGSILSSNGKSLSSGKSLISTFINALDPRTSELIKEFCGVEGIKDMYAAVRWMFYDYSTLVSKDASLENKRLRIAEHVLEPFKQRMLQKVFHFAGGRGGYPDIRRLEDVFKINHKIITNSLSGKESGSVAKYTSTVNDLTLFGSILRFTQAAGDGVKYAPQSMKRLHKSQVGYLDLITTSVGNAGVTGSLLCNAKIDPKTMGFKGVDKE